MRRSTRRLSLRRNPTYSEVDLARALAGDKNLQFANLEGVDLAGANLQKASLFGANLVGANLAGANLQKARLFDANLADANLTGANLTGASLQDAKMWAAEINDANLEGADLQRAFVAGSNLTGANLSHANLKDADLEGANLEGADLRDARLHGANLENAILTRADLRYARLRNANLRGANLREANLEGANLEGANLKGASLRGATIRDANFQGASLEGANLKDADLEGANLSGANLSDANFQDVSLKGADLEGAKLGGADFRGADLTAANLLRVKGLLTVERDERTKWPDSDRPIPPEEHLTFPDPSGSEAFRRWFGNSVVKDETGRPVVVYHGTTRGGFTAFDPAKTDAHHPGFYFTDDFKTANTYVGKEHGPLLEPTEGPSAGRGIYRLYVKMENPFIHDAKGRKWYMLNAPEFPGAEKTYEVAHAAKKAGYDGVIFKNIRDSGGQTDYDKPADVYVVFDPRNIKSATANVGTYDPNDPDIRHNPRRRAPARRRGKR